MTVLITGANRGIGLEMVRQYHADGTTQVIATCRTPSAADDLKTLADDRVTVIPLDVADSASRQAAFQLISDRFDHLDVLINNAGIFDDRDKQRFGQLDASVIQRAFDVNTIAPLMMVQQFAPLLQASKHGRIVNISSQLGSLSHKTSGGHYAYCASKAALNMMTRALDGDLPSLVTITVHPGWVQTDMGGAGASLNPQESVRGILDLIANLKPDHNGGFFNWDGSTHPW